MMMKFPSIMMMTLTMTITSLMVTKKMIFSSLIILELTSSLLIVLIIMSTMKNMSMSYPIMIMTPMMVSEAAIGLSLLTNLMRINGKQSLKTMNTLKW